jgi:hypothetical protein
MEKRLNTKFDSYFKTFKDDIRVKISNIIGNQPEQIGQIMDYIYEYEHLILDKDDFIKRKRVKNSIPENNRCIAKRATGEQCTRRRKDDCDFCGTHSKGSPHGIIIETDSSANQTQTMEVYAHEINGIVYYLDKYLNVYNTEDIMSSKENPRIIAKCEKLDDKYIIPNLNLV